MHDVIVMSSLEESYFGGNNTTQTCTHYLNYELQYDDARAASLALSHSQLLLSKTPPRIGTKTAHAYT